MKIATWNVERLRHIKELSLITDTCEQQAADIFVLTETDSRLKLNHRYSFNTPLPTETAVAYRSTENRVAIFTNYEMVRQHATFNEQTAICVELRTELGDLLIYGVIIGIFGNRHETYMSDLTIIIADIERLTAGGKPICVIGDYNCSFSDNYYYTKDGRLAIEEALAKNSLDLLTRAQPECIDHIAISSGFLGKSSVHVEEWNQDKKLSDHKGILVEIT